MPNNKAFVSSVNELLGRLENKPTLETGIELANQIVSLIGEVGIKPVADVFESSLDLPNAERYDGWFQPHPIFKSDRACFDLADAPLLQAKFYWLKKRSRQILAGGVHFTPNYEDEEFTSNERYKVGLDFFLSPNGKALQIVLSSRGNLRIVELSGRLNNTQREIFEKWIGAGSLNTQEALHTTLWESFKLKSVNQKFYDGVSNSFTELLQHLKSIDKDEEEAKLFASRLLGRLLFCWFLRKKGIIDESVGYFNAHDSDATNYYKQSLERLFFLTLNTPIDERDELTKQHQKALFPDLLADDQPSLFKTDQKTPYLNGGLFEPHINDWYKDDSLTLPEGFFTNLYDHFEEFNFTTDESSPEYEQIAIDPEMLGRVFESLLATQVDATGQQARKAKGAFYTPREIVSYMCKESLRNYLYTAVDNDEYIKESIDKLLDKTDKEWSIGGSNSIRDSVPKDHRPKIINSLDSVTIIDPACGSGAFPMGMLQLMLRTYERLESRLDPYKTKLSIIQNNLFGVDIEPMAVEISRLRAWLSLIVDEDSPRKVEPLPNLDFKFICANSLVPLEKSKQVDWLNSANSELHEKLARLRIEYFNARRPHTKSAAQDKYYKLTQAPDGMFDDTRTKQLKSFDPFRNAHPADFFDSDQMFGLSDGFSVVIGNPPWGAKVPPDTIKAITNYYYSMQTVPRSRKGSKDTYSIFTELGHKILSNSGVLNFILPMAFSSNESLESLHSLLINGAQFIKISNYFDRPKKIFDTAEQATAIILVVKSNKATQSVLTTRVNKRYANEETFTIINSLEFINSFKFITPGRIAKIGQQIEADILTKLFQAPNRVKELVVSKEDSEHVYYRKSGGRYYKIISDIPTGSREETSLSVRKGCGKTLACVLSSSLYFWFYQLMSDGLHIKDYEIKEFPIDISWLDNNMDDLERLQGEYWKDMEKNSTKQATKYAHAKEIRVFHARKSKDKIDNIDKMISRMYGLSEEELMFIMSNDLKFRTDNSVE